MAHSVTRACIGVKDHACVDQCPVECFYEGADQLYIDPEQCIDCGACVAVCPVAAISINDEVPEDQREFVAKNAQAFTDHHADGCGCGCCDPVTHARRAPLPQALPKEELPRAA